MSGNTNKPEETANNDSETVELSRIHERYRLGRQAIKGFVWVAVAICTYLSIMSLAGETTELTGALLILARSHWTLPWSMFGMAVLWALIERWAWIKARAHMRKQVGELELQLDADQNSQNWLKPNGANQVENRDDPSRIR